MPTQSSQYKQLSQFLSQFSILQHSPGSTIIASQAHTYLIRDIEITRIPNKQSNEQLNEIINTLCQHQYLKSKNILGLIDFQIIFNKTKTQSQIRAIYEYGRRNLSKEIKDRKANDEYFDEEALWGLVYSITSPLAYYEEKNIIYGVIDSFRIFLDNNIISILDPSSTGIDPYQIAPNRLYSPELLSEHCSFEEIDMFKSDVYILGLLMLQCALLKIDLYQYDDNTIQMCLSEIRDIYSQNLCQIIEAMLDQQPENRPSFSEILKMINDLFEISTTEVETLQPMLPDNENEGNQICPLDQHSEREVIDILETEYIRFDDHPRNERYSIPTFQKERQHKFTASKNSNFSESMIEEASEYSEASSISLDEPFEKLLEKNNTRINKPKQIKENLVRQDYVGHSSRNFQNDAIFSTQLRSKLELSQISQRPQEKIHKEQKSTLSKQQTFKQPQSRQKEQSKQNQLPQNNFSYPLSFSPLNKDNLFTKPEIMSMIKNDIKKIQDKKRSGLSVHFNYFSGEEVSKHSKTNSMEDFSNKRVKHR